MDYYMIHAHNFAAPCLYCLREVEQVWPVAIASDDRGLSRQSLLKRPVVVFGME